MVRFWILKMWWRDVKTLYIIINNSWREPENERVFQVVVKISKDLWTFLHFKHRMKGKNREWKSQFERQYLQCQHRACLKHEMAKWRNGEMVLNLRAKVTRYNHSDKIIERINKLKGLSKPGFVFVLYLPGCMSALHYKIYFVYIWYKHPTSRGFYAKYMFAKHRA